MQILVKNKNIHQSVPLNDQSYRHRILMPVLLSTMWPIELEDHIPKISLQGVRCQYLGPEESLCH